MRLTFALLALALAGCASLEENTRVRGKMSYHLEPGIEKKHLVWPPAPEIPRYAYAGELMGEANFIPEKFEGRKTGEALFRFLVGLDEVSSNPRALARPQTVTVDDSGRILVTDAGRASIFVFTQKGEEGLDIWEQATSQTPFIAPVGIVQGPRDEIWVADAELGIVVRLNRAGEPVGSFGKDIFKRPTGMARDARRGVTYVADTNANEVKMFDDEGRLIGTIQGNAPLDEEQRDRSFNRPTHIYYADDKLYVTDTLNARIQIFEADGHFIRSFGRRGINPGDLVRPKGVAVDDEGNIYVVESFNDRLIVFNPSGELLMVMGGLGVEIGQFYLPAGLWVDKGSRIYVADMFNGRVVIYQFLGGR